MILVWKLRIFKCDLILDIYIIVFLIMEALFLLCVFLYMFLNPYICLQLSEMLIDLTLLCQLSWLFGQDYWYFCVSTFWFNASFYRWLIYVRMHSLVIIILVLFDFGNNFLHSCNWWKPKFDGKGQGLICLLANQNTEIIPWSIIENDFIVLIRFTFLDLLHFGT